MKGGRSRVISPILPSVSINQVCSMLTMYALMNVGPRLCRDTLKQYMHYEYRTYVVTTNPQRFWIITCMANLLSICNGKIFKMAIIQNFAV